MITTDLDRLEYTQENSENTKVFRSSGTDIPVKDATHIKVYVTTTGTFSGSDFANNKLTLNSHPHLNTEVIRVSSSTDDLPLGLLANTDYFIINKGTNDWQVATSEGSSTVHAFTDAGTGTLTWTKPILKTITTDYTIALSGTTATLTWATNKRPANGDKVLLLRQVPFEQNTDLQNNSLFEAESVETQLDLIVNMSQQLKNTTARDLKFSDLLTAENATDTQATLNVTSVDRANKSLKFDASGNLNVSSIDIDNSEDFILEAKSYATESGSVVKTYSAGVATDTSSYSALEHAVGTPPDGSSKEWATTDTVAVAGGLYSSKQYAANAATSATEAAASETAASASADAVAVMYDAFHDKFLGSMADGATQGTNPTTNGTWTKNSSSITVVSATNIKVGQVVTGTGIPTSPKPNVISIDGTTVVISDNMTAAGSAIALTFTGYGVYGTFNGTKDGPALDNDGDALSDGLLYFNTTDDVMKVYDETSSTWKQLTPTSDEQDNIDTVTADAVDIGLVAGKTTEIGRIGTSAMAASIALIGTDAYAHASTGDIKIVADNSANVTKVADIDADVTKVADIDDEIGNIGIDAYAHPSTGHIKTVADNLAEVQNFAEVYKIAGTAPSGPSEGDLWFDTSTNVVKAYTGSEWIVATTANAALLAGATFTGQVTFNGPYVKLPVHANNSARDSAIGSPANGMIIYNTDSGALQQYNGVWSTIAPAPNITSVSGFLNNDTDSTLTIFGSNFTSSSAVKMFDAASGGSQIGSNATTTFNSNTKLTAVFGAGSIGSAGSTAYIEVDNVGATSRLATAITVNADPVIALSGNTGTGADTTDHLGTYGGVSAGGPTDSQTVMLLNFDRADGSTDIEDSSNFGGDGHKVTAVNDAIIKSSPFGDGKGAIYFDEDYLSLDDSSDWDTGGDEFTIEFWFQVATTANIMMFGQSSSNGIPRCLIASRKISVYYYDGSGHELNSTTTIELNTWYHFALVRDNTGTDTIRLFINGVQEDTYQTPGTNAPATAPLTIGNFGTYNSQLFEGYMDDFRIVNGTCVYRSDFTVPTTRLTAITNTKLLIHSEDNFTDIDGTLSGSTSTTTGWSNLGQSGGSIAWSGTTATITTNTAARLWVTRKITGLDATKTYYYTCKVTACSETPAAYIFVGTEANDTVESTYADISNDKGSDTTGTVGDTMYTAGFTGSTTYYVTFGSNQNSGGKTISFDEMKLNTFIDSSASDHTITPVGAVYSKLHGGITPAMTWPASGKTIGSAGCYFDGAGDHLTVEDSDELDFGTSDFTIDFWCNRSDTTDRYIIGRYGQNSGGYGGLQFASTTSSKWYTATDTAYTFTHDAGTFVVGTWHHVAISRSGTSLRYFVDGVQKGSTATDSTDYSNGGLWYVGAISTAKAHFYGYIDLVRVSKGVARWTSAFTPETLLYGSATPQTLPTITFTGTTTPTLAADEDIEYTSVANTTKASNNQHLTDSGIGLTLTNLTASGDESKATLTGTIASDAGTTHTNMPIKAQVRKTLGDATFSNASTTVTFSGSTKTTGLAPGMPVSGTSIAAGTTISTVDTETQITLSANSTGAVSGGSLIFSDLTRVTHINGSDTLNNSDTMMTIATGVGADPVLFNARRYMGNVTARQLTGYGFQPDLIWNKQRSGAMNHYIYDSVRGAGKKLVVDSNQAQSTVTGRLTSFDADGVSIGTENELNQDEYSFIIWGWKAGGAPSGDFPATLTDGIGNGTLNSSSLGWSDLKAFTNVSQTVNQNSGFSITKFTGVASTTSGGTYFPHNLGGTGGADFVIIKDLDTTYNWTATHSSLGSNNGHQNHINLNEYAAKTNGDATTYNGLLSQHNNRIVVGNQSNDLGGNVGGGGTSHDYIVYAWKAVDGVSAFGTYEGDGGSNRTITTGFKPKFLMLKGTSGGRYWIMHDSFRDGDETTTNLYADLPDAEESGAGYVINFENTGFAFTTATTTGHINADNETFIYAAFA